MSSEEDELASEAAKVDFAYDTVLDQISYMSCAVADNGTYDVSAYFSIRAGAYRDGGGIRLTEGFRQAQNKKSTEKQAALLMESAANSHTSAQLAIRKLDNFQIMYTSTGNATVGQDFSNMFEALGTMDLSDVLVRVNPTARIRYLRNGTVFGSRMEGSLYYTKNPTLAGSIRNALRNDAFLAQTYSQVPQNQTGSSSNDSMARSPRDVFEGSTANPYTQVYGRGYNLRFAQPTIGTTPSHANFPNVILREVSEINLLSSSDRSNMGTWQCPESMRFRIVRPEDIRANKVTCSMAPDPAVLTADLAKVRNQIKVEDWYVDMTNKCIVPKKSPSTCYGAGVANVEYDITKTCTEGVDPACVSFATVCYRN